MKTVFFCIFLFSLVTVQAQIVKIGIRVHDPEKQFLNHFQKNPELTIDHVDSNGYEVYGPNGIQEYAQFLNAPASLMEKASFKRAELDYPSSKKIQEQLKTLASKYPNLLSLKTLGKSTQGKDIWALKISDNPLMDELEPEVKFIANMHGDEIVGRELMVRLAKDLLENYSTNSLIKKLIDQTEIHIVPSMNPDGADLRQRGNANFIDLNRNFPDFTTDDNRNNSTGRAIETVHIMNWQKTRNFALSANFHGGAVVVNYPWDTKEENHPHHGLCLSISQTYANFIDEMVNSTEFPGGIVNGFKWYEVDGGMQDWSFHWHQDLQFTVEVSQQKWPEYSSVEKYYKDHRPSLLKFLQQSHQGFGILMPKGNINAEVSISSLSEDSTFRPVKIKFDRRELYKVLPKGRYKVDITSDSTEDKSYKILIDDQLKSSEQLYQVL